MSEFNFFKFRRIDKNLIESIIQNRLYFAHTSKLNDPFDCQIDIKKAALRASKKVSGEKNSRLLALASLRGYFADLEPKIKNSGICSFTLKMNNPLLWSHYSNEHKGACLMYEFNEAFLSDSKNEIVGVAPVNYGDNLLTEWLVDNVPDSKGADFQRFTKELVKKIFTIKSKCWSYEEEVRIIRPYEGYFTLQEGSLKQICFGLNTSEEDIDLIKKLTISSGSKINYCKAVNADSDFGIEFIDL